MRGVCHVLELPERRAYRWIGHRAGGQLADHAPGASPMHGLLADEVAEILALFDEWGETDRPHRKLAHRGSCLGRVWVSPSSVGRVLFLAGQAFPAAAQAWAQRAQAVPGLGRLPTHSLWIYDTTHFTPGW
jgi:putative transposase